MGPYCSKITLENKKQRQCMRGTSSHAPAQVTQAPAQRTDLSAPHDHYILFLPSWQVSNGQTVQTV